MKRLRVLHAVGNLELGGGQKLAVLVAMALDRDRFEVTVLSLGSSGGYGDQLIARGIGLVSLDLAQPIHRNSPVRLMAAFVKLGRLLFTQRFDVVHTHMFSSALVVAPLARLSGARVFGTAHRIYYPVVQPFLEFLLAFLNERIVVDSRSVLEILRARTRIPRSKYVVIYNCVDPTGLVTTETRSEARAALGIPDGAEVVIEVAHLRPHKGQRFLIEATASLRKRHPSVVLLLVGGGPDEVALEQLIVNLELEEAVRILGPRADLPRLLRAADVLALPSEYEGFGIVQAEAMYFELPVLATSVGGSTEVVVDGVTGYLVPFGDVRQLADRLGHLLGDEDLRRQMGRAGRERVESLFTVEALRNAYTALYAGERS